MYKLVRDSEAFDCDPYLLGAAIRLGERYGCKPLGDLDGFGELVPAEGAQQWAEVLRKLLDDVPNENARSSRNPFVRVTYSALHDFDNLMRLFSLTWPELFSGETKKWLNEFIAFLEKGEFRVWMDVILEIERRNS